MEKMVRVAENLGAGSVKFNILQPTARGERMHFTGEALDIQELVDLGKWVENTLSASTDLNLYYDHPMAFRPLGKMFGQNGDGCGVCGILRILGVLSDGSYALCGIGQTVPELVFGHAATDPLRDIWENTPVLIELRKGITHCFEGICSDCLMKKMCLRSCVAQNYYRNERLWAAYWYCEEAYNRGLFPQTRIFPGTKQVANTRI
jgi:SynChlorMet cassette radical SAM/SPASM protein ScmF